MITNKYFYLLFLLLIPALAYSQSAPDKQDSLRHIPDIELESVQGETISVTEGAQQMNVLFLLPKPESMSKGKDLMADIRSWMDEIRSRFNEKVNALLIVEPLKTSFPFYNIQKGKLKKERFPVVIDKHGEMLEKFALPDSAPRLLVVDKQRRIRDSGLAKYEDEREQEVFRLLERLVAENSGDKN